MYLFHTYNQIPSLTEYFVYQGTLGSQHLRGRLDPGAMTWRGGGVAYLIGSQPVETLNQSADAPPLPLELH